MVPYPYLQVLEALKPILTAEEERLATTLGKVGGSGRAASLQAARIARGRSPSKFATGYIRGKVISGTRGVDVDVFVLAGEKLLDRDFLQDGRARPSAFGVRDHRRQGVADLIGLGLLGRGAVVLVVFSGLYDMVGSVCSSPQLPECS